MKKIIKSTKKNPITLATGSSAVVKVLMLALVLVFFGCEKDEKIVEPDEPVVEPTEEVELEVTIKVPYIIFESEEDLMDQLREAITIENLVVANGRLAQDTEVSTLPTDLLSIDYLVNEAKDLATITLDIAEKYKDDYKLAEGFVNSFAIDVKDISRAIGDWISGDLRNKLTWKADLEEGSTLNPNYAIEKGISCKRR